MDLTDGPKRRRGASLDAALLDAAWAELTELGYADLTFEGVARRARTSRSVVYRRWTTKPELVMAALRRYYDRNPLEMPDTGSLREDLIALLSEVSRKRFHLMPALTIRLGSYFEETGMSIAELRGALLGRTGSGSAINLILARAAERGEIDLAAVTPRIAAVPADLLRNEMIFGDGRVSLAAIESIVDEVFLPLATRRTGD